MEQLRSIDVTKELPHWKLAERIFTERTLPWSRLTAELERSLVQDVRLKAIQKVRGSDQRVALKLKGEARSRDAEEKFIASLQKDDLFQQVILEREAERTGGGVEFEIFLPVVSVPSPYQPFPPPEKPKPWTSMIPVGVKVKPPTPTQSQPFTPPAFQAPAQELAPTPAPAPAPAPIFSPQIFVLEPGAPPQRPDARPSGRPSQAIPPRQNGAEAPGGFAGSPRPSGGHP